MLAYIYIHSYTISCWQKWWWQTHAHTHIHVHSWSYMFTNTHISGCVPLIALPGVLPLHTHTSSCLLGIWLMITHIHTHPCPCPLMIACTNRSFSFMFTLQSDLLSQEVVLHAALHTTCILISLVCDKSYYRLSYCRVYCEISGQGVPVF